MSPGLMKMWISLGAIALMFIAVFTIMFSRAKLKGFLRFIFSGFAYLCVIIAGILMILVVFSGPVSE
ncbi:DUF2768 domain-containing protein [Pseudalkalibacillus caeni]|uniref:DUF2768 domain-containing protein n=1 Tax=Exobacillus caeni TaxID=2574798 RepID=A0A5R9EZP3_9BACL|nr:DUF2768 domain-containing protein [Pseudalkalibacillus caeni]TLS35929.1 DUF2768 domain-containing protein [Pseudalkalibacillus caeni]